MGLTTKTWVPRRRTEKTIFGNLRSLDVTGTVGRRDLVKTLPTPLSYNHNFPRSTHYQFAVNNHLRDPPIPTAKFESKRALLPERQSLEYICSLQCTVWPVLAYSPSPRLASSGTGVKGLSVSYHLYTLSSKICSIQLIRTFRELLAVVCTTNVLSHCQGPEP